MNEPDCFEISGYQYVDSDGEVIECLHIKFCKIKKEHEKQQNRNT